MPVFDIICFAAFCVFLVGASLHSRGIRQTRALWFMVAGILTDFFTTILPNSGCKSLAIGIGSNPEIVAAIVLGVLVWTLFLAAVFVRIMGKTALFHGMITLIKVIWFVDLVLFVYGVYHYTAEQ